MTQVMDVFYVPDDIKGYTCAVLDVQRSWDGTLYGETNVLDWAGRRRVYCGGPAEIPRLPDIKAIPNCGTAWQMFRR